MSKDNPRQILLTHFDWTLKQMQEVLNKEKSDYFRDAALQRFGFTFDLALKCIRAAAQEMDRQCASDNQCFELAVEKEWMPENTDWMELTKSYERMGSSLPEDQAEKIYSNLNGYLNVFNVLHKNLCGLS
jgi:hypothetical protein